MNDLMKMFDTESISEAGSWLHLNVPGTKEKAYADEAQTKPLRIKLKGPDSDDWVSFVRKSQRSSSDEMSNKELVERDAELYKNMTLSIENIPGHAMDEKSLLSMYAQYKDIRSQVLSHIMNRENFTLKPESA